MSTQLEENNDLFFVDVPPAEDVQNDEFDEQERQSMRRLQAPPIPNSSEALIEEDDNAAALAELEDVPMAKKKKRTINRGPKLDTKRLLSARGLPAISSCFKDVKLKGKGYEEEDLETIMSKLEYWTHRLYPKLTFDDCLEKIESLGHKREIQTCLKKIRMGMPVLDDNNESTVITADGPPISNNGDSDDGDLGEAAHLPSTSYIDIFPVTSNTSQQRSSSETVNAEDVSSDTSSSAVDHHETPSFPVGFNPSGSSAIDD